MHMQMFRYNFPFNENCKCTESAQVTGHLAARAHSELVTNVWLGRPGMIQELIVPIKELGSEVSLSRMLGQDKAPAAVSMTAH